MHSFIVVCLFFCLFVSPESQRKIKSQRPTCICIFINLEAAHSNGKKVLVNSLGLLVLRMGNPGRLGDEVIWTRINAN